MSINRIQPAVIDYKRVTKRRFSIPDTVSESFEWVASGGRKAHSVQVPLLLFVQAAFAFCLIWVPSALANFFGESVSAENLKCTSASMSTSFDRFDLIRMLSVVGFGWLIGVVVMAILHFSTKLIKMSRRRDQSLSQSAQGTLEMIKFIGPYISISCGAIAMMIMAKNYYPESVNLADILKNVEKKSASTSAGGTTPDAAAAKAKEENHIDQVFSLAITILDLLFTFGSNSTMKPLYAKNLFPILINTFAVLVFVLTFEKFILQLIASKYRTATTAGRFTENAFALTAIKGLYRTKIENAAVLKLGRAFDADLTNNLFDSLIPREEEGEVLNVKHLEYVMNQEQASKLFGILDVAQNGDLTKDEFASAIESVYDEQETLQKLVTDHDDIISKLDEIMLFAVYALDFALCLTFLGIEGVEMLKAVFGLIVAFGVVFSDALKKMFDALVFVIITHPYDLGDRVEIDGKYLYVESVGLWTTIFNGPGGLKTIMTNASLAHEKIANFRRSPAENEIFSYIVRPETVTEASVNSLKEECVQFFKDNRRDFLSNWHLETADQIDNDRFKIIIKIFHRHNFQNEEAKNERSQKFALYFKDALIRNGFVFSPALAKAIVAHL